MKWSDVKWCEVCHAKAQNEVCSEIVSMMANKGVKMCNLLIFTRIIAIICQVLLLLLLLRCTYAQYEESQHGMMLSTSSIALTYALRGTGNCTHRSKSEIIGAASFRADAAHPLASQSSVCFEKEVNKVVKIAILRNSAKKALYFIDVFENAEDTWRQVVQSRKSCKIGKWKILMSF